ncbi:MAG: type II toxin-antitoxin system RelE/ParE family toxin [Candidatus Delongbacteria bacterium]
MTFEFHPLAEEDLDEAIAHHEAIQPGLGLALLAEVQAACLRFQAFPHAWPSLSSNCRQVVLTRFPYSLILHVEAERAVALALAHHRRHPRFWQDRR